MDTATNSINVHRAQLIEPYFNLSCHNCPILDCSVLRNCSQDCLEKIDQLKKVVGYLKGHRIIMEGNPARGVYFILSGKVKVYKTDVRGQEVIIRLAKPGEMIGFSSNMDRPEHLVSAMAMEDTLLCHLDQKAFSKLLESDAKLAFEILHYFRDELHRAETRSMKMATMSVQERVADALLTMLEAFGSEGKQRTLNLEMSRQDIANLAGTTKEQVSKVLSELKNKGVIDTDSKRIDLLNLPALNAAAGIS